MKSNHHFRKNSWNPQTSSCIGAIFLAVKIRLGHRWFFVELAKFFHNIFLVENLSVIISVSYALGIEILLRTHLFSSYGFLQMLCLERFRVNYIFDTGLFQSDSDGTATKVYYLLTYIYHSTYYFKVLSFIE